MDAIQKQGFLGGKNNIFRKFFNPISLINV